MSLTWSNTAATTAAVTDRFVASTNMKVGAYTVANASPVWGGGCLVTVTHTAGDTADTLGTIVVVGTDLTGATITETITPLSGTVATGTKIFRTVTSVTGAGWVIDGVESTNDTLVVGCAAGNYVCGSGGTLGGILVNNAVAATIVVSDKSGTIVTVPASQAAGTYYNLQDVAFSGFLKVATTNTNDVTLFHTRTIPAYATS